MVASISGGGLYQALGETRWLVELQHLRGRGGKGRKIACLRAAIMNKTKIEQQLEQHILTQF